VEVDAPKYLQEGTSGGSSTTGDRQRPV
jgi:hypothetical protein